MFSEQSIQNWFWCSHFIGIELHIDWAFEFHVRCLACWTWSRSRRAKRKWNDRNMNRRVQKDWGFGLFSAYFIHLYNSKYIFKQNHLFFFLLFTMFTWGFAIQNTAIHSQAFHFWRDFFGWTRKSQLKYSNQHLYGKFPLIQWDSRSTGSKAKISPF